MKSFCASSTFLWRLECYFSFPNILPLQKKNWNKQQGWPKIEGKGYIAFLYRNRLLHFKCKCILNSIMVYISVYGRILLLCF